MKKAVTTIIILILCVSVAVSAVAVSAVYVNGSDSLLSGRLSDAWAIGSNGKQKIGMNSVSVLTGSGLQTIGTVDYNGGGGLRSDSGTVSVWEGPLKIGLCYYYSKSRNTALDKANLENATGSGYAFGYYDDNRMFIALEETDQKKITMCITEDTGIGVYITGTDTLLYSVEYTDKDHALGVFPLCSSGEAITWFSGNQYYGGFEYSVLGGDAVTVTNVVDMEHYVMGVCAREMSESWPAEALKAQALAARTYAQTYVYSSTYYQLCGFDLTGDTWCQAYSGCTTVGTNIESAVTATENQYITYNGRLISALYFSSDGGGTEDNVNVYGYDHPYLKGVEDPYEAASNSINRRSSWTYTFSPTELGNKVGLGAITKVDCTKSQTGNTIAVVLTDAYGATATVNRSSCRTKFDLPGIRYDVVKNSSGNYEFIGAGYGHSVGMSQFGAFSMAAYYNKNYKDIIGFYYTGVAVSYGV